MPNWCANRLYIHASTQNIAEVIQLMQGDTYPLYAEAVNKSIKFFIAGCAGIVKSTKAIDPQSTRLFSHTAFCLCEHENAVSDADIAFTQWLNLLTTDPVLDKETSEQIIAWYDKSGLAGFSLESLNDQQREMIHTLFKQQGYDWFGAFGCSPENIGEYWQALDNKPSQHLKFDMRLVIAPRLIPEIIGFNGRFFEPLEPGTGILTSYTTNTDVYGVKWPVGSDLKLEHIKQAAHSGTCSTDIMETVIVDFDTPWAQPNDQVFEALSTQYQCAIDHYFCEAGAGFCGYANYADGELVESEIDSLEYGDEDEDGCCDVTGPSYILDQISHYGG